jgi:hypothetical protein
MKKIVLILSLFIFFPQLLKAQMNLLPKFIRKMYLERDSSRKSSFVLLPVLSSAPETGVEGGGAGLLSFYTDNTDKVTRVSNIFADATITTKAQERFNLSSSYWTPKNAIHYTAAISYINFPGYFYGLGNNTLLANQETISEKRFKVNLSTQVLIAKSLYAGVVAGGFDYKFANHNYPPGIFGTDPAIRYRNGGSSLYAGPTLTFDSRNNNTYTTKGIQVTTYFNAMQGILTNNSYQGGFFNLEYTQFFLLQKKLVLGLDVQEQSLVGGNSPFYLLPALGSDEMMRGYYNGRYRDRNFLAGQAELRFRASDRIGFVGFVGTGEVFHTSFDAGQLKPDIGAGIRYFFDIEKGLSVRIDYGIGQKPANEPREHGLYIGLGEAF